VDVLKFTSRLAGSSELAKLDSDYSLAVVVYTQFFFSIALFVSCIIVTNERVFTRSLMHKVRDVLFPYSITSMGVSRHSWFSTRMVDVR